MELQISLEIRLRQSCIAANTKSSSSLTYRGVFRWQDLYALTRSDVPDLHLQPQFMIENESNSLLFQASEHRGQKICKVKHMKELRGHTFEVSFPAIAIKTWPAPPLSSSALRCKQSPLTKSMPRTNTEITVYNWKQRETANGTNFSAPLPATSPHL